MNGNELLVPLRVELAALVLDGEAGLAMDFLGEALQVVELVLEGVLLSDPLGLLQQIYDFIPLD